MATLFVDKIDPQSGTTLSLGSSGDTLQATAGTTNNLGISEADQWRLTTTFTGNASPIATNLERNDSVGYGKIGTGMTESSGIFTFPSTGIYFITFSTCIYRVNADAVMNSEIAVTTDNSSYTVVARGYTGTGSLASNYNPTYTSIFLDVTDVSNVKVRFNISSNNQNNGVVGSSGTNTTHMTFLRMGDT